MQTKPGVGWFVYLRIYGPEQAAFDGTWKPGDLHRIWPHGREQRKAKP